jgi:chromosomal replication initiator protein
MVFLDVVQRVASCAILQDALVALLDMFQTSRRLLALSFDSPPLICPELDPKLLSRLASGLVVEVKKPDLDIRRQYLQRENSAKKIGLSKEQILALSQCYQDIRAIDGALRRLTAYRSLLRGKGPDGRTPDIDSIIERGEDHSVLTPSSIIAVVARHFSLPPEEISGKSRTRTSSLARHIAIHLCRELLGLSLVQTGRIFSGRDHSSVLYSIKKIKQLQEKNKDVHKQVEDLRQLCLIRP